MVWAARLVEGTGARKIKEINEVEGSCVYQRRWSSGQAKTAAHQSPPRPPGAGCVGHPKGTKVTCFNPSQRTFSRNQCCHLNVGVLRERPSFPEPCMAE